MPESLKAARERVATEICTASPAPCPACIKDLRELQRQAMEVLLADLEYEQRPDGGWRGVAWTTLAVGYVDALLDGPAPGEAGHGG